jgi:hypothetical protein
MEKRRIIQLGLGTALMVGMSAVSSIAGDPLAMLTHGHQDVLVLGTVVAATPELLQFQPTVEIAGQQHPLGLDRLLKIGNPQPISIRQHAGRPDLHQLPLKIGDRAVVSLRTEGDHYRLAWGAFQVSSLDLSTLRIANVEKSSDLIALQWYLNSCGQENEFSYDGNVGPTMVVQSGAIRRPIGRQQGKIWVALDHPTGSCDHLGGMNQHRARWMVVGLITLGLLGGGGFFWTRRSAHPKK